MACRALCIKDRVHSRPDNAHSNGVLSTGQHTIGQLLRIIKKVDKDRKLLITESPTKLFYITFPSHNKI